MDRRKHYIQPLTVNILQTHTSTYLHC